MSQYWQDREADALNKVSNKTIRQTEKQLKKYYSDLMGRTLEDFEAVYNKLLNATIEGKEPTPADLYKLDAYWQHQAQLREELNKLGEKQIALLSKQFELNFFDIYFAIGTVGEKAFSTIDKSLVQQMINSVWCADGKSWSERIWKNTELLAETLNEELIHCVASGKKPTQLKKLLQDRFDVSYNNADMLVRTEIAHIQSQAALKRYEDAGVLEVQVWASEDERRCEHCGKLHKKKYPIGAAVPIPNHPNCRCNVVPVIDTII